MTIRRPSATFARDAHLTELTALTTSVVAQLADLLHQSQQADEPRTRRLAAIADELSVVLDRLREMQAKLTAEGEDLTTTISALESAHQRYRDLFELAPDAYLVTDAGGRILEANQAAIRLIGYSRAAAYGRSLLSFVAADSAHVVSSHLRALDAAAPDQVGEWEMRVRARGRGPHRLVRARVRRTTDRIGPDGSLLWLLRRVPPEAQSRPAAHTLAEAGSGRAGGTAPRGEVPEPVGAAPAGGTDDTYAFLLQEAGADRRPLAVVELVRQIVAEWRGRPVEVFTQGAIPTVAAHLDAMRHALRRILHHVDQFAPPNAPLRVRVTATSSAVTIVVAPAAGGAAREGRQSRPISPGRVLAPARLVIEAHEGTLAHAIADGGGRAVTVTLPVSVDGGHGDRGQPEPIDGSRRVSRREREVLGLLEQGLTNRQISERLVLSERTVEHHISRMLARFRLSSRTHLAAYALKHDLTGVSSIEGG